MRRAALVGVLLSPVLAGADEVFVRGGGGPPIPGPRRIANVVESIGEDSRGVPALPAGAFKKKPPLGVLRSGTSDAIVAE